MLSGLVLTPDDALEVFRDRRAADTDLDLEHLKRARDILDYVARAISGSAEEPWQQLEEAWALLVQTASDHAPEPPDRDSADVVDGDAAPGLARVATPGDADDLRDRAAPGPQGPPPPAVLLPTPSSPGRTPRPAAPPPAAPGSQPAIATGAKSPWARAGEAPPAPPAAAPPDAAPPAASVAPPDASSPAVLSIDVARLNQIKLSEDQPTTLDGQDSAPFEPLPFSGKVATPPPSVLADQDDADPDADPLMQTLHVDSVAAAITLPFATASAAQDEAAPPSSSSRQPVPPPPAPLPEHLSNLTIEQYASLCAECSVRTRWTKEISARYGVDSDAERQALDNHFRAKMADDPKLTETWRYHYARVEQWARQQKG